MGCETDWLLLKAVRPKQEIRDLEVELSSKSKPRGEAVVFEGFVVEEKEHCVVVGAVLYLMDYSMSSANGQSLFDCAFPIGVIDLV